MKKIIFVGWVNYGRKPVDGETTKNQYILEELQKYFDVYILDFYQKNRHPWIYLQALWCFMAYPQATIILSTSAKNVYSMLKLFKRLGIRRDIIHWVIGGAFGKNVKLGHFKPEVFNYVRLNLVQCKGMIKELEDAGVKNVKYVSNFKPINYYPNIENALMQRRSSKVVRFVFLSRIMREKGCDYILEAVRLLNEKGLKDRYIVDFYGKVDQSYKTFFTARLKEHENVSFYGLLDLKSESGYNTLSTYHAMLFPTFWRGEGFAGVFIDAFIAGLPVLASDWAHNVEAVVDGEYGVIYPVHDVASLVETMERCIRGEIDLYKMAENARLQAPKYQTQNVLTKAYLEDIGLLD